MKRTRLELRDLEAFAAVVRYRHFGAAADTLGITQSAISQRISKLETDLELKLLKRNNQGVEPTEEGSVILKEARTLLAAKERVLETAHAIRRQGVRPVQVLLSNAVIYSGIPTQLRALQEMDPHDAFTVGVEAADVIETRMKSDEADMAITTLPVSDATLMEEPLMRFPVGLAVPSSLRDERAAMPIAALADSPLVIVPRDRDPEVFDGLITLAARAGLTLRIAQEVVSYPSVLALVALGAGWGIVPLNMANAAPQGVSLRRLDAENPPAVTVRLVTRRNRDDRRRDALLSKLRVSLRPID